MPYSGDYTLGQQAMIAEAVKLAVLCAEPDSVRERKALAGLLVDLRATCLDTQGRPDYRAESAEYRNAVKVVFERSKLSEDARQRVTWGVRHHVSQVIRDRLEPDVLRSYGLDPAGKNVKRKRARDAEAE